MSKKAKKVPACTPQSWAEADKLLAEYSEKQDTLTALETRCNAAVARIKARYQAKALPVQARHDQIFDGLQCYAEANRKTLTEDGKTKSVQMTAGRLGWRLGQRSVKFRKGMTGDDVVNAIRVFRANCLANKRRLMATKLLSFIRVKAEPNKDAMLADRHLAKIIDGVRIVEGVEMFYIDPTVAELAEAK
jgi:phage host-nuclease inhibitor protein Gam